MIDKNKYSVYGLGDVSTIILVRELDKRVSDYLYDPEPQYDSFFELISTGQAESMEKTLQALLEKYAKATIKRVVESDAELLAKYGDQLK